MEESNNQRYSKLYVFDMNEHKIRKTISEIIANHWRTKGCKLKDKDQPWFICNSEELIKKDKLHILFSFNELNEFSENFSKEINF